MYANRETISLIHALRAIHGACLAQTNSRRNGNFVNTVRRYGSPADRGHPSRAIETWTTVADLRSALARAATA